MFEIIRYLINRKKINTGFVFLEKEKFNQAHAVFTELKEKKGMDNYFININIAKSLTGMENYTQARKVYFESYNQFKLNPVPMVGIALTYIKEKKYLCAYKYCLKALKLDPIHPYANYYMGIVLIGLNKTARAQKYFEKVLGERKEFLFSRLALNFEKNLSFDSGVEPGEF